MEKKKLTLKEIGLEKLVIMLLCGIFLIVLSFPNLFGSEKKENKQNNIDKSTSLNNNPIYTDVGDETVDYTTQLEKKIKTALKKVEGMGDVEVVITLKSSKELVTLKDSPYSKEDMEEKDSEGGNRVSSSVDKKETTVIVSNEDGDAMPYIVKELEPEIEGVLVIAQGGGNSNTIKEIVEAVEVLFNVPAHKIKVMKMNK